MKIITVHPFFSAEGAKGSEIIAQDTYRLLKNAGHEVYYFAVNKKPYLENADWTKYFPEFSQKFSPEWWWNIKAQNKMAQMLDDIKPDIIHVHGTNIFSYSILKPAFDRNIPVVMTVHDTGVLCPARFGWDYSKISPCKICKGLNTLPCIIKNCVMTKKRISSFNLAFGNFLEKLSGFNNKIAKFITPSSSLADYIECKMIPRRKITVIPNFLNNDFLQNITLSNNQDYFLYVGTLSSYKGVDVLLKAIKELPRDIPFKIAGSGPNEAEYKKYAKENNLDNVEFLGNIDRSETIKYYRDCISLIVPSNYFEIFGMINIEAFACAKPVIGSNLGGIPEIVEDNKTGLIFEPANPKQLAECILKYWENKELAALHGNNALNEIGAKYSEQAYYNRLIETYNEVLDEQK